MSAEVIAVHGLGYVGLPLAVALARHWPDVIGYDKSARRVAELQGGDDRTGEIDRTTLAASSLAIADDPGALSGATVHVVTVPTPITENRIPDLGPMLAACETIGGLLRPGGLVVIESTVYPGVTEDVCGPLLAERSGLVQGRDFFLGYSPERINPGDREHALERVVKVVSGDSPATLDRVARLYAPVIEAGLHRAPSIRVAEAAKVIENVQRDVNIALMNELSMIFERLGIPTWDVLAAARTKWNFLGFTPGLVGGHCIGVDPYYLAWEAERQGHHPQLILAGRRINDQMGRFVAIGVAKALIRARPGRPLDTLRVTVAGITFKENVPDTRNSRVPTLISELRQFGFQPVVVDPLVDPDEARSDLGVDLADWQGDGRAALTDLDALVLAVPHREILTALGDDLARVVAPGGVIGDVKDALPRGAVPTDRVHWTL